MTHWIKIQLGEPQSIACFVMRPHLQEMRLFLWLLLWGGLLCSKLQLRRPLLQDTWWTWTHIANPPLKYANTSHKLAKLRGILQIMVILVNCIVLVILYSYCWCWCCRWYSWLDITQHIRSCTQVFPHDARIAFGQLIGIGRGQVRRPLPWDVV